MNEQRGETGETTMHAVIRKYLAGNFLRKYEKGTDYGMLQKRYQCPVK